ncbi:MAG: TIGR01244 family sulfur transferase, partial [Sphingomicrobium sp.]
DHEDEGQPLSGEIEEAAGQAGVEFRFIPIARGIGPADVEAMHNAMQECGDGKLLAFCRSGTRSTFAWAVARAREGVAREELEAGAAKAGVDLSAVAHLL